MTSRKDQQQKRCLGALFHSQARLDAHKEPLCAGLKSRLQTPAEALPRESVPAGQFKYACIGYSIYEKELKSERAKLSADPVELPYCEGLEIISASELMKSPATLNEGAGGASVSGHEGPRTIPAFEYPDSQELRQCYALSCLQRTCSRLQSSTSHCYIARLYEETRNTDCMGSNDARIQNPARPRPGRSFVPGGEVNTDWDAFTERFLKTSRKIVDRMGNNLAFMGRSAKQTIDRWGRWGDED